MSENRWGPPEVVEKIAKELEERAASHRRVADISTGEYRVTMQRLANECEKIARHLREGRESL